jgi:hypothetical protein
MDVVTGSRKIVPATGQFGREVVEDMSRVSRSRQQDHGAPAAAPVEDLHPDSLFHDHETDAVRGWVAPASGLERP